MTADIAATPATAAERRAERSIIIVDDHPLVAEGWGRIIRAQLPSTITTATSALEGWRAWRAQRPDLMVIDLTLGDNKVAGIKLIARLRTLDPGLAILVCTMHRSPVLARRALHAGANGIINKDSAPDEILTALSQVMAGNNYIENRLATQIALMEVQGKNRAGPQLTSREEEVLSMIADGLSYKEIAERACISYKTVTNISLILRDKLGASSLANLVVKGIRHFEGMH